MGPERLIYGGEDGTALVYPSPQPRFGSFHNSPLTAMKAPPSTSERRKGARIRWLNRTVLGIGLTSLFSNWSHEIATTLMPADAA